MKGLRFEECGIGDEGLISFSAILPKTNLVVLCIGGNNISSRGLMALADAIMNTPNFKTIDLFSRYASTTIPGTVIQNFLGRVMKHPQFFKYINQ